MKILILICLSRQDINRKTAQVMALEVNMLVMYKSPVK